MSRRVTIMLDDRHVKNCHLIQSKMITNTDMAVSFSSVINILIEAGIKAQYPRGLRK